MGDARGFGDFRLYARLLREARPYWLHVAGIFFISLLATPLALLMPLPFKIAIDNVIENHPPPEWLTRWLPAGTTASNTGLLIVVGGLAISIALLAGLRVLASELLEAYTGEKLVLRFRAKLFGHGQQLSLAYHDTRGTADSAYRIQYDAMALELVVVNGLAPFLTGMFTLVAMILVTARLDWELALIALAVIPLLLLLTLSARGRLRKGWRETKKLESAALAVIQEVLTGLRVVKAYGAEQREEERFVHRSALGVRARLHLAVIEGGFGLLASVVLGAGMAAVLVVGVRHVQEGTLTLGSLALVIAYVTQLQTPLKTIGDSVAKLQSALASAERAFSLLDELPDVPQHANPVPLGRARGSVEFRNVSFEYEDGRPAVENVSFAASPGQRIGVAGATGAGKTTLASLLCRLYDPTAGEIRLDGVDIRRYDLADLRNQFAIVLQEPVLFSTTIGENIAYADPDATEEDIVEASRAANIHDFVMSLPDQYDTLVGERGMRLSGGERQRITLARAFLKDARILILDEPTSSVDTVTETLILDALDRLMRNRTTFIIAHRLGTLEACDVRLHIDHGRVAGRRNRYERQPAA